MTRFISNLIKHFCRLHYAFVKILILKSNGLIYRFNNIAPNQNTLFYPDNKLYRQEGRYRVYFEYLLFLRIL